MVAEGMGFAEVLGEICGCGDVVMEEAPLVCVSCVAPIIGRLMTPP